MVRCSISGASVLYCALGQYFFINEIRQKAIKAEQFAFGALLPAAKVIEMETERRKELLRVEITVCFRRIPN